MEANNQRVIELYNSVKKKKQELKVIQKEYKDLHKSILVEKMKSLQARFSNVDLKPSYSTNIIAIVSFLLPTGKQCDLLLTSSESEFSCVLNSHPKMVKGEVQYDLQFQNLAPYFKGIFTHQRGIDQFYTEFLPYQYDEVFYCFEKAFKTLLELGAEASEYKPGI